ncbi:MAG: hypothetical protein WCO63_13895 [Bacteroidota bacterium]
MNKFFYFFILLGIISGCTKSPEKRVVQAYPSGNPKVVRYFEKDGSKEKMVKEEVFYENKRLQYSGEFKDSLRNGHWVYYYENGNPWSEGDFKNGLSDGMRKTYFENGKLRYEGGYKAGKMSGIWKFYHETGKLDKEVNADTIHDPQKLVPSS